MMKVGDLVSVPITDDDTPAVCHMKAEVLQVKAGGRVVLRSVGVTVVHHQGFIGPGLLFEIDAKACVLRLSRGEGA